MHFIRGLRHRRVALAAIAIFAVAGGVAYAAIPDAGSGVYHACMLKNVGTIRIIDPERQRCSSSLEVEITFNKEGPAGDPGATGPPGPPGQPGRDGRDGRDGAPFSGTFTSPNGQYSLSVTDTGIVLSGAGSTVNLTSTGVQVRSAGDLTLQSGSALVAQAGTGVSIDGSSVGVQSAGNLTLHAAGGVSIAGSGSNSTIDLTSSGVGVQSVKNLTLLSGLGLSAQAGTTLSVDAGSSATFQAGGAATFDAGSAFSIVGSTVRVNPGSSCRPAARAGDAIAGTATPAGVVTGAISNGSGSVCIG